MAQSSIATTPWRGSKWHRCCRALHSPTEIIGKCVLGDLRSVLKVSRRSSRNLLSGVVVLVLKYPGVAKVKNLKSGESFIDLPKSPARPRPVRVLRDTGTRVRYPGTVPGSTTVESAVSAVPPLSRVPAIIISTEIFVLLISIFIKISGPRKTSAHTCPRARPPPWRVAPRAWMRPSLALRRGLHPPSAAAPGELEATLELTPTTK